MLQIERSHTNCKYKFSLISLISPDPENVQNCLENCIVTYPNEITVPNELISASHHLSYPLKLGGSYLPDPENVQNYLENCIVTYPNEITVPNELISASHHLLYPCKLGWGLGIISTRFRKCSE